LRLISRITGMSMSLIIVVISHPVKKIPRNAA